MSMLYVGNSSVVKIYIIRPKPGPVAKNETPRPSEEQTSKVTKKVNKKIAVLKRIKGSRSKSKSSIQRIYISYHILRIASKHGKIAPKDAQRNWKKSMNAPFASSLMITNLNLRFKFTLYNLHLKLQSKRLCKIAKTVFNALNNLNSLRQYKNP